MSEFRRPARHVLTALLGLASWLATEQMASAQTLLAQSGAAKTIMGWMLSVLAIVLGLLVICRPSGRKDPDAKERKRK